MIDGSGGWAKIALNLYSAFALVCGFVIFGLLVANVFFPPIAEAPVVSGGAAEASRGGEDRWREFLAYRLGLATLLAALSLPLLLHRARINERQADVAEEGHVTDRIIKATELLGAVKQVSGKGETARYEPNVEVRLGAIFTLERVAKESATDCATIMETFAAYVRENLRRQREEEEAKRAAEAAGEGGDEEAADDEIPKPLVIEPREDVLAVLRAINRRNDAPKKRKGEYDFEWAEMSLALTDLRSLFPSGSKSLPTWRSPKAKLWGANLEYAGLIGAHLEMANLVGAQLKSAKLASAHLERAVLFKANLENATLVGAKLAGANLVRTSLFRAHLARADLARANLRGAKLAEASLVGVAFTSTFASPTGAAKGLEQSQLDSAFGDKRTAEQVRALGRADLAPPNHWELERELTDPEEAWDAWQEWRKRREAESGDHEPLF